MTGKSLLTTCDKSTKILTCCSPIMRRNCCDAYGYLHRKWAYFASQIAMRYQLFPSLIIAYGTSLNVMQHIFNILLMQHSKHYDWFGNSLLQRQQWPYLPNRQRARVTALLSLRTRKLILLELPATNDVTGQ